MFPAWLRRSSFVMLSLIFGLPLIAWAQTAAAEPVPTSATTTLGAVLQLAQIAVVSALALALAAFGAFLFQRAKGTAYETAVKKLWNLFTINAGQAYGELGPMLKAALADGTIDAKEEKELKAKLVELVQKQAGPLLNGIFKAIGVLPAGVQSFLEGMADRALRALLDKLATKAAPVPSPDKPKPAPAPSDPKPADETDDLPAPPATP